MGGTGEAHRPRTKSQRLAVIFTRFLTDAHSGGRHAASRPGEAGNDVIFNAPEHDARSVPRSLARAAPCRSTYVEQPRPIFGQRLAFRSFVTSASHASTRTTQLYDQCCDKATLADVELIGWVNAGNAQKQKYLQWKQIRNYWTNSSHLLGLHLACHVHHDTRRRKTTDTIIK